MPRSGKRTRHGARKGEAMTVQLHNSRKSIIDVTPRWTGTCTGYQMGYLSEAHKRAAGLPTALEYAIRIDGQHAELVQVINGYTAYKCEATIL